MFGAIFRFLGLYVCLVLIKYSGKYVKIYFNMKITYSTGTFQPLTEEVIFNLISKLKIIRIQHKFLGYLQNKNSMDKNKNVLIHNDIHIRYTYIHYKKQ